MYIMKKRIKKETLQMWEQGISDVNQHRCLLPRVCEAVLYVPPLTSYFIKKYKKYLVDESNPPLHGYDIKEFCHYGVYDLKEMGMILNLLIKAEHDENLRWELLDKFSSYRSSFDKEYVMVNDVTSAKSNLDGYLKYYYNWLYFSLPTRDEKAEQDIDIEMRKKNVGCWEEAYIENLKAVDLFTEWVNEYIINETFLQYEKAVYDVFVKLNFKNKDLADLMEPEYIKFMLMQEKTKDFMKLFKAPSFRKTEFNLPKELNGLNKGKELSFRDHLEYNFFVYHSLTFSKDKSIFEFLQKRILGRNDIRKIVRDSVYLLLLRDEVNIREYEYELSWLVVLNLVVLAQNKEREFLLNDYKDVYGKIKSNNVNSDDKKFLKMLKEKKDEIASLKQSLSKAEEKATSDVTEYKRRAKEQEKIIYELNKKIRELESKNKEPEEAEELKAEIVIEKEAEREVTEEEFLDIINKYNICIYGGIPTWQAKVKKKYPQLHMIEAVGTPSLKPLDKACMIIYVNIWTSHCAWERVDNYASNLGLPKGHLNNYNIKFLWEVVVKEIEKLKLTKSS